MTNKERIASVKPLLGGAIVGAIATLIVGFSAGWLVTSGSLAEEVRLAQVTAYGTVCTENSVADWKDSGQEMEALDGWGNRDARKTLAARFIPATESGLTEDVQRACERGIEKAA